MSYIEWIMKGVKIAACSCDHGCPCEFNAVPTRTPCEGLEAMAIDMASDFEARTGHLSMPGVAELSVDPIKNPVTGKPHHAMMRVHTGFEFRDAEMASGTAKAAGDIQFDFAQRYGFLSRVHYPPYGMGE